MNIYVGIYAAIAFANLSVYRQPKINSALASVVLVFLFLFAALRLEVGCDWFSYELLFDRYSTVTLSDAMLTREPAFYAMLSLIGRLGLPYIWVNIATAAILCIGIFALLKLQNNKVGFILLCFPFLFTVMAMSGVRQAAAIGLICLALSQSFKRNFMFALVWVVAALTFHNSAALFLLFIPFFSIRKFTYKIAFFAVFGPVVAYLILHSAAFDLALDRYVDTGFDAAGAYARIGLLAISSIMMLIYHKKWRARFPNDYDVIMLSAITMLLLIPLTLYSTVIGDRLGYYFIPMQAIIFSRVAFLEKGLFRLYVGSLPFILMGVSLYVWTTKSSLFQSCYIPYQVAF